MSNLINKIVKEAFDSINMEETLSEITAISTPTVTLPDPPSYDYNSPEERKQKKKKAEREKGYREEGRYE